MPIIQFVFTISSIQSICLSQFVMLSPASIIYADLSKLAQVKMTLCDRELYVSEWELLLVLWLLGASDRLSSHINYYFRKVTEHETRNNILSVVAAMLHFVGYL